MAHHGKGRRRRCVRVNASHKEVIWEYVLIHWHLAFILERTRNKGMVQDASNDKCRRVEKLAWNMPITPTSHCLPQENEKPHIEFTVYTLLAFDFVPLI